jgi:hypothetical protein
MSFFRINLRGAMGGLSAVIAGLDPAIHDDLRQAKAT